VMTDPTLKAQLAGRGSYPLPMSPTEVTAFIQDQQRQWAPVLQQLATKP
jgi:tripartite-type tricarboxylate transporter receptor subunit TctC